MNRLSVENRTLKQAAAPSEDEKENTPVPIEAENCSSESDENVPKEQKSWRLIRYLL